MKNERFNVIMSDYERHKNINMELMRNLGSPKVPVGGKFGQYEASEK